METGLRVQSGKSVEQSAQAVGRQFICDAQAFENLSSRHIKVV